MTAAHAFDVGEPVLVERASGLSKVGLEDLAGEIATVAEVLVRETHVAYRLTDLPVEDVWVTQKCLSAWALPAAEDGPPNPLPGPASLPSGAQASSVSTGEA